MHEGAQTPCALPQPLLELLAQSWLVCTAEGSAVEPPKVQACLFLAQGLGREKVSAVGRYSASSLEVDCLGIFLNLLQFAAQTQSLSQVKAE